MNRKIIAFVKRLEEGVTHSSDPPFVKHGKTGVVLVHCFNIFSVSMSIVSSWAYMANVIVFAIALLLGVGMLVHLFRTKNFALFLRIWLVWSLLLPTSIHVLSGGYASANVMGWGMLAPVAAAILLSVRSALVWCVIYIIILFGLGFLEPFVTQLKPMDGDGILVLSSIFNYSMITVILVVLLRYLTTELERSRKRSDDLLLNILPASVADRLKQRQQLIADRHESVTVLFADIVGFTKMASEQPAEEVVGMLNSIVTEFDALSEAYGLEKIKTIGDAYMVVGGLVDADFDVARMLLFAADMLEVVASYSQHGSHSIQLRIGMNTGPVLAGVIGKNKFAYDIWGDTVNTASRMESSGSSGKINVSDSTYALIKDDPRFTFDPRGKVDVKGKGEMDMYFVSVS